jgi:nitroreductase
MNKILFLLTFLPIFAMSQEAARDALTVIHQRKSVKEYLDTPIPEEKIEMMLKAAMAAPSSRNVQPWRFYVVTNRAILEKLSKQLPNAAMLAHAPLAIVVCGDIKAGNPNRDQEIIWTLDCSAASQNLLLAAEALELGATWTGVYPFQDRIQAIVNALSLPENIIPLNIIPIGYPLKDESPKDKWDLKKVTWVD